MAMQGSVGQRGRTQAVAPPSVHDAATAPLCTVAGHLLSANDAALVLLNVQRSRQRWMRAGPGTQPLSPVEDGVEMMKILCGIYESAAKGAEVRL